MLLDYYDEQDWWPAEEPFEVIVGAILTQNTSWTNVEKALDNLRGSLDAEILYEMDDAELAKKIRPSGFYNIKVKRLKNFLTWFRQKGFSIETLKAMKIEQLRKELLSLNGIGGETADAIILYAVEKPIFVIDAYTRRIFTRIGYDVPKRYESFQAFFHEQLKTDVALFNQYHALIVEHAKSHCRTKPLCATCPLKAHCQYGQNA